MILSIGEELPSAYLDSFMPQVDVPTRVSILSLQCVALEYHYMDFPNFDIKGSYQCSHGACCDALGIRNQTYAVPVMVYKDPRSLEGSLQMWRLAKSMWRQIEALNDSAAQYGGSLLDYDLIVTSRVQGKGKKVEISFPPGDSSWTYRKQMTEEQLASLQEGVDYFFKSADYSICKQMTVMDWNTMLIQLGYDVVSGGWMNQYQSLPHGQASKAISSGFSSASQQLVGARGGNQPRQFVQQQVPQQVRQASGPSIQGNRVAGVPRPVTPVVEDTDEAEIVSSGPLPQGNPSLTKNNVNASTPGAPSAPVSPGPGPGRPAGPVGGNVGSTPAPVSMGSANTVMGEDPVEDDELMSLIDGPEV